LIDGSKNIELCFCSVPLSSQKTENHNNIPASNHLSTAVQCALIA